MISTPDAVLQAMIKRSLKGLQLFLKYTFIKYGRLKATKIATAKERGH
jgi:hypothetical protein